MSKWSVYLPPFQVLQACSKYAGTAIFFQQAIIFASELEKEHITKKIWKHLNNWMHGLPSRSFPWHPKAWLKSLSKIKWCLSMEKARNVSQSHARGSRGENRTFGECLATVSQVKIQWLLCWSQLCCYKSTDYFCVSLDLQHCNQPHSLFGSGAAKELYFLTKAHSGDFSSVTQQVVYLLKIKNEDTACPILLPLMNIPYLVRVRNKKIILIGIGLCFATFYFDFEVTRLMPEVFAQSFDRQTNWLQHWGLSVSELSHEARGLEGVTKCPTPYTTAGFHERHIRLVCS